jgi:hypothetical protein
MRCSPLIPAFALFALGSCSDVVTHTYSTLDDARKDRLFERGWLPDILPSSARDFTVSNNLDVNTSDGEFAFDPIDFGSFAGQLRRVGDDTFQYSPGKSTWTFYCDSRGGHCRYTLR